MTDFKPGDRVIVDPRGYPGLQAWLEGPTECVVEETGFSMDRATNVSVRVNKSLTLNRVPLDAMTKVQAEIVTQRGAGRYCGECGVPVCPHMTPLVDTRTSEFLLEAMVERVAKWGYDQWRSQQSQTWAELSDTSKEDFRASARRAIEGEK